MNFSKSKSLLLWWLWLVAATAGNAQVDGYRRVDTLIVMRDGVSLYTEIYAPTGAARDLPILFTRTPYGVRTGTAGYGDYRLNGGLKELRMDGYIFVFQDIRCKYKSEGTFSLLRPLGNGTQPDESTDAFDSIDWLVKHVPGNSGKVGMLGISYNAWLAAVALINPHPALAAVSLQGTPADLYKGDDFFHHGAFRLSPSFGYAVIMQEGRDYPFPGDNAYDWFLRAGSLAALNSAENLAGKNPYWNDFMAHPDYDSFWQRRSLTSSLRSTTVPVLHVAGWWDDQDLYGSLATYAQLEENDARNLNYLVAGPWYHAGWEDPDDYYKTIHLGGSTSPRFLRGIQAPWFRYHLKGEGRLDLPEATVFTTGSNTWEAFRAWPPREMTVPVRWYLNAGGTLTRALPPPGTAPRRYVSDPANPVPYMAPPVPGFWSGGSLGWKADDQAFVTGRNDVLVWASEPLAADVVISGNIRVKLFAATTGTDCDWVVKLVDCYPPDYDPAREGTKYDMDNFQQLVADEVIRARYRKSLRKPEAVVPGRITGYDINLLDRSHCFKKGHRIMVHVQSSWFPLIDRNPQQFVPIHKATAADYQRAEQSVYGTKKYSSYVELPVRRQGHATRP